MPCELKYFNVNFRTLRVQYISIANQVVNWIRQQGWHFKISHLIYANKVATENLQTKEQE